ncbi:MAG: PEGA domain-containing protein [Elusimicrobiota bacterium]
MNNTKTKILIIDDDTTLGSAIKMILDSEGYDSKVAASATNALQQINKEFFDILLCDYNLPDMQGIDMIKKALKISAQSVPVLITGVSSMDLAFDGMRAGVHDYLVKPIDYEELKKIIKSIVEEKKKSAKGKEKLQEMKETLKEGSGQTEETPEDTDHGEIPAADNDAKEPEQTPVGGLSPEKDKKDSKTKPAEDGAKKESTPEEIQKEPGEESSEEKAGESGIKLEEDIDDGRERQKPVPDKEDLPATEPPKQDMPAEASPQVKPKIKLELDDKEEKPAGTEEKTSKPEKEKKVESVIKPADVKFSIKKPAPPILREPKKNILPPEEDMPPPGESKEKTIFDFVLDRYSKIKKKLKNYIIFGVIFVLLFISVDTVFLKLTALGKQLHNMIWPPAVILDSIPSGARVSLTSESGMDIIEGSMYTPVEIPKIAPGNYSLKMEIDIYNPVERVITVYSSDKKTANVSVSGNVQSSDSSVKTQKFIIPFELRVEIESEPAGAAIYIDGKRLGAVTPFAVDLTADQHTVLLEKEGFANLGNIEMIETYGQCNIDLTQQSQNGLDARYWQVSSMQRGLLLKGTFWKTVRINSDPKEAQFFIDGELTGVTPLEIKLKVGKHNMEVKKTGFAEWQKEIEVPDDESVMAELLKRVKFIAYGEGMDSEDIGAEIWVDREKIEGKKTPFYHVYRPGTYRISVLRPPDFVQWTKSVKIGDKDTVIARLLRKKYFIEIKITEEDISQPVGGAEVYIDGEEAGQSDENGIWKGSVKSGYRDIKIKKERIKLKMKFIYEKTVKEEITAKTNIIDISLGAADATETIEVAPEIIEGEIEEIITPELSMQEKKRVSKDLDRVRKYFDKGKLDKADSKLVEVFKTDPENMEGLAIKKAIREKREKELIKERLKKERSKKQEEEQYTAEQPKIIEEEISGSVIVIIDTRPHFPGAAIFFDGKREGETIRRIGEVPLGTHEVSIEHPYIGTVTNKVQFNEPDKKIVISFSNTGEVEIK